MARSRGEGRTPLTEEALPCFSHHKGTIECHSQVQFDPSRIRSVGGLKIGGDEIFGVRSADKQREFTAFNQGSLIAERQRRYPFCVSNAVGWRDRQLIRGQLNQLRPTVKLVTPMFVEPLFEKAVECSIVAGATLAPDEG